MQQSFCTQRSSPTSLCTIADSTNIYVGVEFRTIFRRSTTSGLETAFAGLDLVFHKLSEKGRPGRKDQSVRAA
jgi:hypothetical protein